MARLTIEQVRAPDLSVASQALANAGRSFQTGMKNAQDLLGSYQEGQSTTADANILRDIAGLKNEEELNSFLQNGQFDASALSEGMRERIFGLRDNVLKYGQSRADVRGTDAKTLLTGAQTGVANANIGLIGANTGRVRANTQINLAAEGRTANSYADTQAVQAAGRQGAGAYIAASQEGFSSGNSGPKAEVKNQVYSGLINRGISEHIAQGFMMNFQDESAFNVDITEGQDNVHGTRGKGLYQLTGSRRDAFESKYGNNYSIDNQLDFMMEELGGSESAAWRSIQQSQSAGEAGALIVKHFLRPAKEHENSRSSAYLSGGGGKDYGRVTSNPQRSSNQAVIDQMLASGVYTGPQIAAAITGLQTTRDAGQSRITAAESLRVKGLTDQAELDAILGSDNQNPGDVQRAVMSDPNLSSLSPGQLLTAGVGSTSTAEALNPILNPNTPADPLTTAIIDQDNAAAARDNERNPQTRALEDSRAFNANPLASLVESTGVGSDGLGSHTDQQLNTYIEKIASDFRVTRGEAVAMMTRAEQKPPESGIFGRGYLGDITDGLDVRFPKNKIGIIYNESFSKYARTRYDGNKLSSGERSADFIATQQRLSRLRTKATKTKTGSPERKLIEAEISELRRIVRLGGTGSQ